MPALRPGRALRPLLSLQARSLLYGLGFRGGRGRARLLGAAALVVLLAGMAVAYMWVLGGGMVAVGAAEAIPALAALAGSLAAVALVFVKAPGTVFGCRDYDLVAALPVSVRAVVLARTVPLYGFGVALSVLLSAPLYAAYFLAAPVSPPAVVAAALCSACAPLAPAAVATLASLALTSVAVRFRHAGAVQLVLSVLVVTGVVVGSLALGGASSGADDAAALAAMGDVAGALSAAVASAYPPAAWAASAVCEGSVAGFAAFAALSLALPALVTGALAARYPHANAVATSGPQRRAYAVAAPRSAASPLRALAVKELRRIGSMPFYAMNNCAGLILMVVAAGAVALFGADALLASGVINGVQLDARAVAALRVQVDAALPWVFGFCGAMSLTAAPSVSLESRASWLMLTAPVGAWTVLGQLWASCTRRAWALRASRSRSRRAPPRRRRLPRGRGARAAHGARPLGRRGRARAGARALPDQLRQLQRALLGARVLPARPGGARPRRHGPSRLRGARARLDPRGGGLLQEAPGGVAAPPDSAGPPRRQSPRATPAAGLTSSGTPRGTAT